MKTLARLVSDAPRHAMEDVLGLAALCLLVGLAFSATALV